MAKRYSEEFKVEAVRLYRSSGLGYRRVSLDLGVSAFALRKWVAEAGRDGSVVAAESEELRRLKRENSVLREERDILRKAAAFFAKEVR